ncbi:MAG: hypothetical protein KUA43_05935 [Hoeflea sp.]|uniref:DUF6732 family protein n=1 Tax=Hoeflea sp. TaxID=1940281 RepID=UPI001D579B10|nr:DUF6732 family protein [Hoeflea sp.]MBU4531074.1 hypothetical protein [Alphaproteobacteria bacterium]MBU4542849.1 hypothetical protein [Alphaproteobacteria bacterium]MBU4552661.1 hypothetical protein [Alphaproteobacteria bacterium]MBV1722966.1 hypothetical protein [Hoeflea sp.]MBV1762877.1 hypothetical protein [Hoeflea sp.]
MRTLVLSLLAVVSGAQSAFAHAGHVGDLAGHSHWLGWAAAAAAGAIAAWAIKRRTKAKDTGNSKPEAAGAEARPEAAEA